MPNFANLKPVTQQGSQPNFSTLKPATQTPTTPPPQQSLSESIWGGLVGASKAVTNTLGLHGAVNTVGDEMANIGNDFNPTTSVAQKLQERQYLHQPSLEQAVGAGTQIGATLTAPLVAPESIGGAALAGAGAGAAQSGGAAMTQNAGAVDVAKQAGIGGTIGGITGGVLGAAGKALSYLPKRLVQGALPKLDAANIPYALENTHLGTVNSMLSESKSAVSDLGSQLHDILASPQYAQHLGQGSQSIDDALAAFPDSEFTRENIIDASKSVAPQVAGLITKIDKGTANLAEKNQVRMAIDQATKKIFTDSPQVSTQKQIAAALASELRSEVKTTAPETVPLFGQLSKELNLRNALQSTAKRLDKSKPVNLMSVLSFMTAGLPAAIGEEFARAPGTAIAAAKALPTVAKALKGAATPAALLASETSDQASEANQ